VLLLNECLLLYEYISLRLSPETFGYTIILVAVMKCGASIVQGRVYLLATFYNDLPLNIDRTLMQSQSV